MNRGFNSLGHILAHFKNYRELLESMSTKAAKEVLNILNRINELVKSKLVVFTDDAADITTSYPGFIAYSDMSDKEIVTLRLLVNSYYQQVVKL